MPRRTRTCFEVDVAIKRTESGPQEERLVMPVWTPGSYMVRELARHVQDFAATDAAGHAQVGKDEQRHVAHRHQRRARVARALSRLRKRAFGAHE